MSNVTVRPDGLPMFGPSVTCVGAQMLVVPVPRIGTFDLDGLELSIKPLAIMNIGCADDER
jgi:hypothetical protein